MTTATVGTKNPKYKWEVLALLWVAFLLNQADRQVFNVVLPLIREDLGLSDVAIGSIATVFNLFYAVLVPIGGLVGDARAAAQRRHGRRRGLLRTGQLFAAGAVPRQDPGLRHVGPSDRLLHRHHHQRLCRGLYRTAVGLAQRLLRLRRHRRRARRRHGRAAEGQEGAGRRRRRGGRGAQAAADGGFPHGLHHADGPDPHRLLRRTDLRADGLPHVDAHLPLREFRHGPRGRRFPLDVLHPSVRLRRRAAGRPPLGQARGPACRASDCWPPCCSSS